MSHSRIPPRRGGGRSKRHVELVSPVDATQMYVVAPLDVPPAGAQKVSGRRAGERAHLLGAASVRYSAVPSGSMPSTIEATEDENAHLGTYKAASTQRGKHVHFLVLTAILLCVGSALALVLGGIDGREASVLTERSSSDGDSGGGSSVPFPFQVVERKTLVPTSLFGDNAVAPFPSGAWWSNLAVADGDQVVAALPYQYKINHHDASSSSSSFGGGLQVSYGPLRRTATADACIDWFGADLVVGATTWAASHAVDRFDPLSVDIAFFGNHSSGSSSSDGDGGEEEGHADDALFTALLARGSPYVTVRYGGDGRGAADQEDAAGGTAAPSGPIPIPERGSAVAPRAFISSSAALESWRPVKMHDVHWDQLHEEEEEEKSSSSSGGGGTNDDRVGLGAAVSAFAATYANGATWLLFFEGADVQLEELGAIGGGGDDDGKKLPVTWGVPGLATVEPFRGVFRAALIPPALDPELLSVDEHRRGSRGKSKDKDQDGANEAAAAAARRLQREEEKEEEEGGGDGRPYENSWSEIEAATAVLMRHATAYPTAADVTWDLHLSGGEEKSSGGGEGESHSYSYVPPLSGDEDAWWTLPGGETATYSFRWTVAHMGGGGSGGGAEEAALLMMTLPHHRATMAAPSPSSKLRYSSLKGGMVGAVGERWDLQEPLSSIGFTSRSPLASSAPPRMLDALEGALQDDMLGAMVPDVFVPHQLDASHVLVDPKWIDPYGFGKAVARAARLALVAEELGNATLRGAALSAVEAAVAPWLEATNVDALVYDATWGGLISTDGTESQDADFGNGWYNDHHFHYGYFVYTLAVLARAERGALSPSAIARSPAAEAAPRAEAASWQSTTSSQHRRLRTGTTEAKDSDGSDDDLPFTTKHAAAIDAILRDFANPGPGKNFDGTPTSADPNTNTNTNTADVFFPQARHHDWFDGHSWASGLFPMANGKSQESVSEAINAYYGVHLLGLALRDEALSKWGRLLLATEVRAAHHYWQMTDRWSAYPAAFSATKMAGVVGSTDVKVWTWFGSHPEYVHGINMMPFTPITEELLSPGYVTEEYPVLEPRLPDVTDQWLGIIELAHAVINKSAAFVRILPLQNNRVDGFDAGNSLTNSLYWIATREGGL